jgi:hypothetical protein
VLDVRRDRAVAAEEFVLSEQPQIARPRHRMLRCLRRVVRVGQTLRAVGEQIAQLQLSEPGQRQVETAEKLRDLSIGMGS